MSRAFFNFLSESQCLRSSPSDQGCIYRIVLLHVYEKLYNIRFLGNHRRLWYKSEQLAKLNQDDILSTTGQGYSLTFVTHISTTSVISSKGLS